MRTPWTERLRGGVLGLAMLGGLVGTREAQASFEPVTCKNAFTVDQEIAEGNKVAAQVYRQMPVLPESSPVSVYVQRLGAKLTGFAPPSPGTGERWPYNFHVVASEEINAFALPGGSIFVNLGTIQAAETEAQLAGVIAHEISHVVMRHSTCNLSKQRNRSLLYGLGAIGSAVLLGNGAAGQLAQAGIGLGQNLDFLHMSRDDERQADLLGVNILYRAGYDPRGLPQFFETIQAKYGAGGAQLLSDHPNPGNRTEYVNAEIATLPQRTGGVVTTPEFRQVRAQAQGVKALTAKEVAAGGWRSTGLYAPAAGSNGAVVPAVAGAGAAGGTGTSGGTANGASTDTTPSAGGGAVALSRAELGLGGATRMYQAGGVSLRYPAGWQASTDADGAVFLAPARGAGAFGLVYGVLVSTATPSTALTDEASLARAAKELARQLAGQNQGTTVPGDAQVQQVKGGAAAVVEMRGRSPLVERGAALPERDVLVAFARPDGRVSYLVCVAPERDFATMKPTFDAMVDSFRMQ